MSTESDQTPSAIDRFLWSKGTSFSASYSPWSWIGYFIGAAPFAVMVLAASFVPQLTRLDTNIRFWIFLNLLVFIGIFVGLGLRERARYLARAQNAKTSRAASALIWRIFNHVGWTQQSYAWQHTQPQWIRSIFPRRTASQVIKGNAGALLEQGATQAMRLIGLLEIFENHPSMRAHAAAMRNATDESMVELFNIVASVEQHPEISNIYTKSAEVEIAKMKELADRFERLAHREHSEPSGLYTQSTMDQLLEKLRLEERATRELDEFERELRDRT